MPRVIGIDPGTVSIDLCGLDQGRVFLDRSWPTAEALADPARFILELEAAGPLDLVAGPSGYGLPLTRALEGEGAYLAGEVSKALRFQGGAAAVAGWDEASTSPERLAHPATPAEQTAWEAFVEGAVKTAVALAASVPSPKEFVLSGRLAQVEGVSHAIRQRLSSFAPTRLLEGFARTAKEGAQGAALLADGLAGGANRELVELLAIREARGTVLDHLYVIPRERARRRLEGGPA